MAEAVEDGLVGRTLSDRYRILKKLGEGGMGVVYLAEHVMIEKRVALKILSPDLTRRADLCARFLQEAKSASRIGHENVIDISDFGQSPDGFVYFAMEYLEGQDLGQALRASGGIMPWTRAKPILIQICRALRAAHNRNIIHRDIKPENIYLIQREGRPDFVKVLDFGIAKIMGLEEDAPRLTRTGMIFGTPDYMSPEQAQGHKFDHRVDVYAVGCIAYQMLTGHPPFRADTFMGILSKHMFEAPVKPSLRRPEVGVIPEVDALIMTALEKNRDTRFADMTAMLEAVAVAGGGSLADVLTHQQLPTLELGSLGKTPVSGTKLPTVTPPGPTRAVTPGAGTRSEGGIDPSPLARASQTEVVSRGSPAPAHRGGLPMAIGIAILAALVGVAIVFLTGRSAESPAPSPLTAPPVAPPAVAPPSPSPGLHLPAPSPSSAPSPSVAAPSVGASPRARAKPERGAPGDLSRSAVERLRIPDPAPRPPAEEGGASPRPQIPKEMKDPFAAPK